MAETKTRASSSRSKATKRKPAKATKAKASTAKSSNGASASAAPAKHGVGNAASSVGRAASKAKTPLLAGSAAVAGVAGGIALGRNSKGRSRRPKVKIDSHDLAKAAREVGQFGADVGQLAAELRRNREAAHGTKKRSPIEVVLEGLTSRGNGSS